MGRSLRKKDCLNKRVRTLPVRPADGMVGCVYESFVPGVLHRWMEKEILWFCFRRAEPERMISGWTASSRDSSKPEEGKALLCLRAIPRRSSPAGYYSLRLRPAKTKPQYLLLHPAMPNPRDERLIYIPDPPVRWPYRRRPHLLN